MSVLLEKKTQTAQHCYRMASQIFGSEPRKNTLLVFPSCSWDDVTSFLTDHLWKREKALVKTLNVFLLPTDEKL